MAEFDLSRWALFARKDDSGFGRMSMMMKTAMGIQRHIAIPSDRLEDIDVVPPLETWLSPKAPLDEVIGQMEGLQGIFFFEHTDWHPQMLEAAQKLGIKTVCIPMWEWFSGQKPAWKDVDLIACPSEWTLKVVRSYGMTNASHLTWPVDADQLPERLVVGPAKQFFHNAGLVDAQDRKGTADSIIAFRKVNNPDLRLIVRMQKEAKMPRTDDRIEIQVGNIPDYAELYKQGDVAIQPSKMEGIGFMVLEPFCCGIPTITTDYPPMNEFVTDPRMLVKPRWGKRKAFPTAWIPHAHLRIPQTGDLANRIQWCAENDLSEISRANRQTALEKYDRQRVQKEWYEALDRLLQ